MQSSGHSIRRSGFEFNVTAQTQPYHHLMEQGLVSTCQQQSTANIFFQFVWSYFFCEHKSTKGVTLHKQSPDIESQIVSTVPTSLQLHCSQIGKVWYPIWHRSHLRSTILPWQLKIWNKKIHQKRIHIKVMKLR